MKMTGLTGVDPPLIPLSWHSLSSHQRILIGQGGTRLRLSLSPTSSSPRNVPRHLLPSLSALVAIEINRRNRVSQQLHFFR
ncbi:hypothetical protein ROD_p1461 (plasmid) [Citrobacter rodentium ICC168]|uniref:Uncharacterized protein n=1 Tax=Citrobacter rodentium (strain ICC168) TaxID=637910 RepID=D2TV64_CITRI|nr:hypothetical protein ROD_p1461 [Citrobacter rodentium ICC168]